VKAKGKRAFNLEVFLAGENGGRRAKKYKKGDIVFTQGDTCDGVFYIRVGSCKITVVSDRGKRPWSRYMRRGISLEKAV
jgi:CRP-like cAMP-binding protein